MRSAKLTITPKTLPRLNAVYDVNILTHSIKCLLCICAMKNENCQNLPLLDKRLQLKAPQTRNTKNPP